MSFGIMEASITLNLFTPRTNKVGSTTESLESPILHVPQK